MKQLILILFACVLFVSLNAQFKTISEGPVFKEPESGYGKILQFKNGGTMFLHITGKDGIDVRTYNEKHAELSVQTIEPAYGKLKSEQIEAIFEINGDGVLLISEKDEKKPVLYRLVIDGKKGTLKSETTIATLDKITMGRRYAEAYGKVVVPGFYVKKDPYSDNYAVVLLNSFEEDRNKRLEIVFYNKDHKEISHAYYSSPDDKYKYMNYIDMVVVGDKTVNVLAYAYNTKSSGGKESELVIATLEKGADKVSLNELNFTKDFVVESGITAYNPVTKRIIMVAAAKEKAKAGKTTYMPFMAFIDPYIGTLEHAVVLYPQQANKECVRLYGEKKEFTGLPQNVIINKDGNISVVFEEMQVSYTSNSVSTTLGNLAVAVYDHDGKEISGYFIPKSQISYGLYLSPFYHARREGTAQLLSKGNQYKSFAYLAAVNKTYILVNDIEENTKRGGEGRNLNTILGVGDCDGFYYTLAGKSISPNHDFVFGPPAKRVHNLALFSIADYNDNTNIYATLKLQKGKDEGVSLIWLTPQ